jgi:hypothetical protein
MTTLREFYDILSRHDFWYDMSDDPGVRRRGREQREEIERIAGESPAHDKLWLAWYAARTTGSAMPPRPTE